MKKFLVLFIAFILSFSLVACNKKTDDKKDNNDGKVSVTFYVDNEQYGEVVYVTPNRRVTEPTAPTKTGSTTASYSFSGWYLEDGVTAWDFSVNIVKENTKLYAKFTEVATYPTDLKMADEAVTSKISWSQSVENTYEVYLDGTKITGTTSFDATTNTVTFTPSVSVKGGTHSVKVVDTNYTDNPLEQDNMYFHGEGTESNPYLITTALDFKAVNQADVSEGKVFKLLNNITVTSTRANNSAYTFNGTLNGNGKVITSDSSNAGLIYRIGPKGSVNTLYVAGSVSTTSNASVGALVDYNEGTLEKIWISATVTSESGLAGTVGFEDMNAGNSGIAGGVCGTNEASGKIINCSITSSSSSDGVVKARICGGCIVGYNKGTVEYCTSEGCFGAWNSTETGGKSLSTYSYGGGIAGVNAGKISKCSLTGSGKLLAQRYGVNDETLNETTSNSFIGGIAGYNTQNGVIELSEYSGIRVHGDLNVGGIAGGNAGTIKNCIAQGNYASTKILSYVGARKNAGGIAGLEESTGTITNCISTVNVYAYVEGTAYSVASASSNSLYLGSNPNAQSPNGTTPVALTAPTGSNTQIEFTYASEATANFVVAESYLASVNADNAYKFDTTVKLSYEALAELTMVVRLHNGTEVTNSSVAETKASLASLVKLGYTFKGYSYTEGGEVDISYTDTVGYYTFLDKVENVSDGIDLYAVFTERVNNEKLIVAVWDRYVEATAAQETYETTYTDAIIAAYKEFLGDKLTYEIEVIHFGNATNTIGTFGPAINAAGNIDVIIGSGSNITSSGKVPVYVKGNLLSTIVTATAGRQAALLSSDERAVDLYCYLTGAVQGSAEVTIYGDNDTTSVSTVDGLYGGNATIPTVTVAEGYEFKGWATSKDGEVAIEATLTSKISYADVKDLLEDGKVSLYPVVKANEVVQDPTENQDEYDLVVLVHLGTSSTTYITEDEIDAAVALFEKQSGKKVRVIKITGKNATGLIDDISANPDADIYIGGNNIDTTSLAAFNTTDGPKAAVGSGWFANTSRKVGIANGCKASHLETAKAFYALLTAAKPAE